MSIFDKIINKEIPAYIVYEDEIVLAFLDIAQITKGHTLVIPKQYSLSFLDTKPDVLAHLMTVTQTLANQIKESLNASGINILTNAGKVADQGVDHFHVHIIPRYDKQDGYKLITEEHPETDKEEVLQTILNSK